MSAPVLTETRMDRWLWIRVFTIMLLVVISVVSWRRGVLYDGGTDPVVIAKAAIGVLTFSLAFFLHATVRETGSIGIRTLLLLTGIVVFSTIGALAAGDLTSAAVLAVRIGLVTATVVFVVRSAPPMLILTALVSAIGVVAIVAAVTGAPVLLEGGRLVGGIPTLQPNELAGLAGPPAVALAYDFARRGLKVWTVGAFLGFLGIIYLTESRTSLLAVSVAIVVAMLYARPLPSSTAIGMLILAPFVVAAVTMTSIIQDLVTRGESVDRLVTLNSRTNAWSSVLEIPMDTWAKWIGLGLSTKTIAVQDRWRDYQVLDSSWVSAIAQAGIIGTVLLIIWVLSSVISSLRSRPLRALTTPLLTLLLFRSFTENGLVESSATFLLFLTISLVLERGTVYPLPRMGHRNYELARWTPETPSWSAEPLR